MSFYDKVSFYIDNGEYHPSTGIQANGKRTIRYAAAKYFTKGTLPGSWHDYHFGGTSTSSSSRSSSTGSTAPEFNFVWHVLLTV